jgi:hypothetical protein
MSNEIKAAVRATVKAIKAEMTKGETKPELQDLTRRAIEAAERAIGPGDAGRPRKITVMSGAPPKGPVVLHPSRK